MERGRVIKATGTDPRHGGTGVRSFLFLCGVAVDPGVDFAFFPSQVLADPVGGQFPFSPFLADGALGNGQYRGYFAGGEHPVGPAERSRAWPYSFPVGVRLLFVTVTGLCFHGYVSPPFRCAFAAGPGRWRGPAARCRRGRVPQLRWVIAHVHVHGACVALRA